MRLLTVAGLMALSCGFVLCQDTGRDLSGSLAGRPAIDNDRLSGRE
jgi:hypothetical protein